MVSPTHEQQFLVKLAQALTHDNLIVEPRLKAQQQTRASNLLLKIYQTTVNQKTSSPSALTQQEAFTYLKYAYGLQPQSLEVRLEMGLCLWKVY